jgi:hypothetical protein
MSIDLSERTNPQLEHVTSPRALSMNTLSELQVEQTYRAAPSFVSLGFLVLAFLLTSAIISLQCPLSGLLQE